MASNFDKVLELILKNEGGYTNNPNDTGGPTNLGITQATLSEFLGRPATIEDVQNLSVDTAKEIYKKNYWDKLRLDEVKSPLLQSLFMDQCVNRGPGGALRSIQQALSLNVDGVLGPITLNAINSANDIDLALEFCFLTQKAYVNICVKNPTQLVFLPGWINRSHVLIKMIQAPKVDTQKVVTEFIAKYLGPILEIVKTLLSKKVK